MRVGEKRCVIMNFIGAVRACKGLSHRNVINRSLSNSFFVVIGDSLVLIFVLVDTTHSYFIITV